METDAEIKGKAYVHWKAWHEAYPGMVDQGYLDALTLETCEEKACRWRDNLLVGKTDDRVRGILSGEEAGIRFREFPRSLACRNQCFEFLHFSGNDVFDRNAAPTEARSPGSDYGSCRSHKAKGSFLPLQNRTRNSLDPVPCEMRRQGLVQNTSTGSKSVASEISWLSICCYNGLWSAWLMCRLSFLYPFCHIPAFFVLFRPCSRK